MTRFRAETTAAHDYDAMHAGRRKSTVVGSAMAVDEIALSAALQIRRLDPHIGYASFLFEAYKPRFYYFEVVETFRRILFTSVVLLIRVKQDKDMEALRQEETASYIIAVGTGASPARLMFSLMVSLVVIALYNEMKPYADNTNNYVSLVATWQVALTILGALILQSNDYYHALGGRTVVAVFLCFVNISAIAAVAPAVAAELHKARRKKRKFKRLRNAAEADLAGPQNTSVTTLLTRDGGEAIWNIKSIQRDVVSYSFIFVCLYSAPQQTTHTHDGECEAANGAASPSEEVAFVNAMAVAIQRYDALLRMVNAEPDTAFFRWHGEREYGIITRSGVAKARALLLERCIANAGLRAIVSGTNFTGQSVGRELKHTNAAIELVAEVHTRRLRLRLISDSKNVPSQVQMVHQWGARLQESEMYIQTKGIHAKLVTQAAMDGDIEGGGDTASYIVDDSTGGGRFAMKATMFAARYDITSPDSANDPSLADEGFELYPSTKTIWATELTEDDVSVHFPMGQFVVEDGRKIVVKAGDFLGMPCDSKDEVFAIPNRSFSSSYKSFDAKSTGRFGHILRQATRAHLGVVPVDDAEVELIPRQPIVWGELELWAEDEIGGPYAHSRKRTTHSGRSSIRESPPHSVSDIEPGHVAVALDSHQRPKLRSQTTRLPHVRSKHILTSISNVNQLHQSTFFGSHVEAAQQKPEQPARRDEEKKSAKARWARLRTVVKMGALRAEIRLEKRMKNGVDRAAVLRPAPTILTYPDSADCARERWKFAIASVLSHNRRATSNWKELFVTTQVLLLREHKAVAEIMLGTYGIDPGRVITGMFSRKFVEISTLDQELPQDAAALLRSVELTPQPLTSAQVDHIYYIITTETEAIPKKRKTPLLTNLRKVTRPSRVARMKAVPLSLCARFLVACGCRAKAQQADEKADVMRSMGTVSDENNDEKNEDESYETVVDERYETLVVATGKMMPSRVNKAPEPVIEFVGAPDRGGSNWTGLGCGIGGPTSCLPPSGAEGDDSLSDEASLYGQKIEIAHGRLWDGGGGQQAHGNSRCNGIDIGEKRVQI